MVGIESTSTNCSVLLEGGGAYFDDFLCQLNVPGAVHPVRVARPVGHQWRPTPDCEGCYADNDRGMVRARRRPLHEVPERAPGRGLVSSLSQGVAACLTRTLCILASSGQLRGRAICYPSGVLQTAAQRLTPRALVSEALDRNLRQFLMLYGDTQFLLVGLGRDAGDLKSGLLSMSGCVGTSLQPSLNVMSYDTILSSDEVTTQTGLESDDPNTDFDAETLVNLLIQSPHFAIALRKRSNDPSYSDRISLGRARNKDVVLRDSSISKFHAWLEMDEEGGFYLADAGSTNGTRLDGVMLTPMELVRARPGVSIRLGSVKATLCTTETLWRALHDLY